MAEYKKLNVEPIEIEYVVDEHNSDKDFEPSFWWDNKRYYLDNFIRTNENPWSGIIDCPEYIHGYEADNYFNPLFIELINDEAVNVYKEVCNED